MTLENSPKRGAHPGFTASGAIDAKVLDDPKRRHAFLTTLASTLERKGADRPLIAAPAACALVAEELATAAREVECLREARVALRHLSGLKRHLYAYQSEGVRRFLERGRLLLADDMWLGKTTQAIAACHALFHARLVRRGLIVTPASLKPQWLREWNATTDTPAVIVDGNASERAEIYRSTTTGFLIVNYEIVLRDFELLLPFARELVVLDEAQRIKNYATKSAMYVKMLPAKRRLVLTGTPMENRFDELASILDWVDDRALAPKWRLAAWHFRHEGDGMNSRTGARNLGTMRERLAPCVVRRLRADVIDQLPARTDTRVPVAMTAEQQDEHDALIQPIKALMAIAEKRPLTQPQFLRLMQLLTTQRMISNGLAQVRFDDVWPGLEGRRPTRAALDGLFAPKLDEVRSLVEALVLAQDRKVVIFSQWRRMLKLADWAISDLLASTGRRSLFFTGAESAKLRTQSLVDFHDDPKASVLFLTDAGGVGLNLQHAANACVNLELPWNPAVLEQRIGRIYRLGQKRPIDVYNLVAEP
ncbi:MAG: DEAD/DEAH box helicase, partial [Deltaproteobacteria bacterium]